MGRAVAVREGAGFGLRVGRAEGALTRAVAVVFHLHDFTARLFVEQVSWCRSKVFAGLRDAVGRGRLCRERVRRVVQRLALDSLFVARTCRKIIRHNHVGSIPGQSQQVGRPVAVAASKIGGEKNCREF